MVSSPYLSEFVTLFVRIQLSLLLSFKIVSRKKNNFCLNCTFNGFYVISVILDKTLICSISCILIIEMGYANNEDFGIKYIRFLPDYQLKELLI